MYCLDERLGSGGEKSKLYGRDERLGSEDEKSKLCGLDERLVSGVRRVSCMVLMKD